MKSFQCLVILGCLATLGLTTPSGKKLLSFPTLVSILKAKNATRPLSAPSSPTVEKAPLQPQIPGITSDVPPIAIMVPPNPFPASIAAAAAPPEAAQVESPPSPSYIPPFTPPKQNSICAPISKETNDQIARLCDINGRKGTVHKDEESVGLTRAGGFFKRFCVTIIPAEEEEDSDDDDLESALSSSEIKAYTDCDAVQNLFKVLVKSEVSPKCYDCSR